MINITKIRPGDGIKDPVIEAEKKARALKVELIRASSRLSEIHITNLNKFCQVMNLNRHWKYEE